MALFRRGFAFTLPILMIAGEALAQVSADTSHVTARMPELRSEILRMVEIDQKIRNDMVDKIAAKSFDSLFVARMDSIDRTNTRRIKEMVRRYGWPGTSLVGTDGARAAFLIVQHSPDTLFQRECLELMQAAFRQGEVYGPDMALLLDRVRVREGKPQVYGSQAKLIDGKLTLEPIEDEANVDKRRAEIGLPPLAEYLKFLKQYYHAEEK